MLRFSLGRMRMEKMRNKPIRGTAHAILLFLLVCFIISILLKSYDSIYFLAYAAGTLQFHDCETIKHFILFYSILFY